MRMTPYCNVYQIPSFGFLQNVSVIQMGMQTEKHVTKRLAFVLARVKMDGMETNVWVSYNISLTYHQYK